MSGRKIFTWPLAALVLLLCAGSSPGMELGQGFLGLPWETDAASLSGFELVGSKDRVDYYINPQVVHTIGDVTVSDEIYGFFEGRFFAVYLNIDSIDVFSRLKGYLNSKYGTPDMSMTMKREETIYKWKHQKVKIKLKMQQASGRMKLGFYYVPVAREVNAAEIENYPETAIHVLPIQRDKRPRAMPLLEF
jgi:hypothetical protein